MSCIAVLHAAIHLLIFVLNVGLPKLNDANNAGTKHSADCTLILTEGDSAMSLAVAGLAVIGRDNYGVFPLRSNLKLSSISCLPCLLPCVLTACVPCFCLKLTVLA